MKSTPMPTKLAWQLTKRPGSDAYDALVGESLWMYGMYPNLSQDNSDESPAYFRPYEVYEKLVRRLFSKLHVVRQPSVYSISQCSQIDGTLTFVGRPHFDAPSPYKPRGVLKLKFEDDHGFKSDGTMRVYFPGTATAEFKPDLGFGAGPAGGSVSLKLGQRTKIVTVKPIREDPLVNVRVVTGDALAEYLNGYLRQMLESYQADSLSDLSIFLRSVAAATPIDIEQSPSISDVEMQPGQSIEMSLTVFMSPETTTMYALEVLTESGSVMSDVIEIHTDANGQSYEL
jgi:hypothetical protein